MLQPWYKNKYSLLNIVFDCYFIINIGFAYKNTSICTQVVSCGLVTSTFYINGEVTMWSHSTAQFNISYDRLSGRYNFCFTRISEDTSLTEYCHVNVPEDECFLCSIYSGKIEFVSHSHLIVKELVSTQGKLMFKSWLVHIIKCQADMLVCRHGMYICMYMWRSQVENLRYSYHILTTFSDFARL